MGSEAKQVHICRHVAGSIRSLSSHVIYVLIVAGLEKCNSYSRSFLDLLRQRLKESGVCEAGSGTKNVPLFLLLE